MPRFWLPTENKKIRDNRNFRIAVLRNEKGMSNNLNETLERALKGERSSQEKIYLKHYNYAISVAMRYGGSRFEAQEIVQDAFVNMFKRLETFDLEREFRPWFRRIVINSSIDYYRKYHKANEIKTNDELYDNDSSVDADVLSSLSANDIMLAVQQLPPSYRIVFVLHVVEGFKHEEIAEQLGITVGTTKSNLFKAKAQLREMLNQWNHAD